MPAAWVVLAVGFLRAAVRDRQPSVVALLFFASTTMFWQEWFADWGPALVYNRQLLLFESWTSTTYQTYWKPVGVFFGYGLFFAVGTWTLLRLVPMVLRALPTVHRGVVISVTAAALFWVFDMLAEGLMTALGWYSYTDPLGREFGRLAAWAVTLNLLLFVTQPLATGLIRVWFLTPSPYIP